VIDLHLHTTASDGFCTPDELVAQAAAAGLTTIAVTDHDTTAAIPAMTALCNEAGLTLVPAIEITAMEARRDVHMLGYFIDPAHEGLQAFLARARASRIERVRVIAERLASLGVHIDVAPLVGDAAKQDGRSIGRPQVARAIVAAGHATDVSDAFDRWLSRGKPGFVPRAGASPEQVIDVIHAAGGLASMAHPVLAGMDDRIPALRDAGLDALEAYHSEHDQAARGRYLGLARSLDLLVTGGSDYHGDPSHGLAPGTVTLPAQEWERLSAWPRRSSR
jgi:3',5'-nucleoside bisphosphate phosphatase